MRRVILLLALPVALLAGCAGPLTPAPEAPPADGGTFGSIDDLVAAYEAAGGDCSGWEQTNVIDLAAESGDCDDNTVLSTYASESDRDKSAENVKSLSELIDGVTLLVGANWIINDKAAGELQDVLGGTIIDTK
jgi:hypothetical protein